MGRSLVLIAVLVTASPVGALDSVNVKDFGALCNGVSDDRAAIQAAVDTLAAVVTFPEGVCILADGTSILVNNHNQTFIGVGKARTTISSKNAYAFLTNTANTVDRVVVKRMGFTLREGSVSGGAIRLQGDIYRSQWLLQELAGGGVSTSVDPVFDLSSIIGSVINNIQAASGQIGLRITSGLAFNANANTITESRFAGNSDKGIHLVGANATVVSDSIIESNGGWGIYNEGGPGAIIEHNWFEHNNGHIFITGGANNSRIARNHFFFHPAGSTRPHIKLVGPPIPQSLNGIEIAFNRFPDSSGSTFSVEIDAQCAGTKFLFNEDLGRPGINDLGTGTMMFGNHGTDDYNFTPSRIPNPIIAGSRPYYGGAYPTLRLKLNPGQTQDLLQLLTSAGAVLSTGFDANGYVGTRIVATASLPPPSTVMDGKILIEDAGVGVRNVVIYAGGQRFRLLGGAAF